MKKKDREFKSGTILTDGKSFIFLGSALKRDWSYSNTYGRKRREYMLCKTYPKDLFVDGIKVIQSGHYVYGLWLQEGHHLFGFIPIKKKLINPNITKHLGYGEPTENPNKQ